MQSLPLTSFLKLNTYRYLKTDSVFCITVSLSYPRYFRPLLVRMVRGPPASAFWELVRNTDAQAPAQNLHFNRFPSWSLCTLKLRSTALENYLNLYCWGLGSVQELWEDKRKNKWIGSYNSIFFKNAQCHTVNCERLIHPHQFL